MVMGMDKIISMEYSKYNLKERMCLTKVEEVMEISKRSGGPLLV